MKNYLAVFIGKQEAMAKWGALSEEERQDREKRGMLAWTEWVTDNAASIVHPGSPLGKTKRVNANGVSDFKNEICAFTVVTAESHEAATKIFLNHPHFMLFPGDSVEVIEGLPVPQMK